MIVTDCTQVCILLFRLKAYFQGKEYIKGWRTKTQILLSISIRECLDSVKVKCLPLRKGRTFNFSQNTTLSFGPCKTVTFAKI